MDAAAPAGSPAAETDATRFAPLAEGQRIEALDVVRGFALLGIFLMNIEWFNRPFAAFDEGIPEGLAGADWLASWFIAYFVQGKFWTIFSLLFGMGFAVMLARAERAGRPFAKVYLRRILALAVFGALHYLFLWHGDILFSYAVGALALLIALYGRPRPLAVACAVLIGLGFLPGADAFFRVAGGVAIVGLLGLYLRGEKRLFGRAAVPLFSFLLLLAGAAVSIAAAVLRLWPDAPIEPRVPTAVLGPLLLLAGWISWRFPVRAEQRGLRLAVAVYVFAGLAMTLMALVQHVAPDPLAAPAASESARAAERVAKAKAERAKKLQQQAKEKADEIETFTRGRYADTVEWRAGRFVDKAADDAGFAVVLVGMFLLGMAFVRSGVMDDTTAHRKLFRALALYGLPLGIGIGVSTGLIALSHVPGDRHDGWRIAHGLQMLGNLPACLGYVGLVVTMLHSRGIGSRIRVLGPPGRMALTNYLLQSLVCAVFFYGFALGHWGLPRAQQVLFVVVVYAAQVAFSHWWLARFRYGPVEWLWRGFTYRQVPSMRLDAPGLRRAARP